MSEKELKRKLKRYTDRFSDKDCKVRGIGKHSWHERGKTFLLSNLVQRHQNASQTVALMPFSQMWF